MIRVNLLRTEKKDIEAKGSPVPIEAEAEVKKKAPAGNLLALLVIVLLAALAYLQQKALGNERALLNAARTEKAQLEPVVAKLDQLELRRIYLRRKIGLINQLKARQGGTIKIMEALSASLPEWVWLTEAALGKQNLQIKGRALSNLLISDYMRNLSKHEVFEYVSLLGSTQKNQGGNTYLEFSLSAVIAPTPDLQPNAEPAAAPSNRPGTPAQKIQIP